MLSFVNGDSWAWRAQLYVTANTLGISLEDVFERSVTWAEEQGIRVEKGAYAAFRKSLDQKPEKGEKQEIFIAHHVRRFVAHVNDLEVVDTIIPLSGAGTPSPDKKAEVVDVVAAQSSRPRYARHSVSRRW